MLETSFTNGYDPTYNWSDTSLHGANPVTPNLTSQAKYFVTITEGGNTASDSVVINVANQLIPPVISFKNDTLFADTTSKIQWYKANGAILNANGKFYIPLDTGNYYAVSVNDSCFSEPSNSVEVLTTNIKSNSIVNDISVFPNPATNQITVKSTDMHLLKVSIFNLLGDLLYQRQLNNSSNEIDISFLSKGIYMIKIESTKGTMQQKLIKE